MRSRKDYYEVGGIGAEQEGLLRGRGGSVLYDHVG